MEISLLIAIVVGALAGLAVTAVILKFWSGPPRLTPPTLTEIARIEERVRFSLTGGMAVVLLLLHQTLILSLWQGALGSLPEAAIGIAWIAGNVLWGIGVIVGRRRSYRVFRLDPPSPPN